MADDSKTFFWRGGERIELEKEKDVFTTIIKDEAELEQVQALPGVSEVKPVQDGIFKVQVDPDQRDATMALLRSANIGLVAHHAYRPVDSDNTRYYLTERITVKFKPGVEPQVVEKILAEAGLRLVKEYPGAEQTYLLEVTAAAGKNPIKIANELMARDEVIFAEPNLVNRFQSSYIPPDTYFNRQWHLRSWNGPQLVAEADVAATTAWDITRGHRGVVIAIVDDGVDLSHPDFATPGKVVHPKDYVDGDANPFPVTSRGDYHGTPCAGVAVAEETGDGVVGVAPGCALMPVRFPLSADDDLLWEIFDYVGQRADVISCSWGPVPAFAPLAQLLKDKFAQLAASGGPRGKGCVILFAAGNYNAPIYDPNNKSFEWFHPSYGLRKQRGPILNGNAAHPDVIAVAASTSMNRKAAYSNWGLEISVCAPSNNFHPLDPGNSPVPGRGIWTTDNEQHGAGFSAGSQYTGNFGGTSSATPLAAGIAALMISANPDLTAKQVKEILQETADKIVDPEPDIVLGLSKGSYNDKGHSEWFGYGKVNAAKAVQRAYELRQETVEVTPMLLQAAARSRVASEELKFFKITLGQKLSVTLDGPEGEQDFDLYLKRGSLPTTKDYDARGYTGSADEKITLSMAEPGDYYIMVRSYWGEGEFSLKVELG
jgi:subtilisin family serine protease